ncbi:uncharacterized protein A4U43_C01F13340 [Asparagus officinalis]|uniref:Uncharacterized protein n=1 Tax=Asparagus officinalis TaxID=4686 RepID=A0A5P1FP17_ASPOF|nr:uncharacterized protein A4U43_C01F13340 [Asparagus officinalis]
MRPRGKGLGLTTRLRPEMWNSVTVTAGIGGERGAAARIDGGRRWARSAEPFKWRPGGGFGLGEAGVGMEEELLEEAISSGDSRVMFHIMTLYISIRKLPPSSIHELLPDSVKSFSVSSNGHFTVNLQSPCYIHFDYLVHYADAITGVIKYGSTDELKGIKAEEEFELVAGHRFSDEGRGGIHAVLPFDLGFCLFTFLRNRGLGFGW